MKTIWSVAALADLKRTIEFLEEVNVRAALTALETIELSVARLIRYPHMGESLERFEPRQVRRLIVDNYELHYTVSDTAITILRVWHHREDRPN